MLGFGALGEFALGEGPNPNNNFVGGSFSQPNVRKGLAVAVIATTFAGFVAPPAAKATPVFSDFSAQPRPPKALRIVHQPQGLFVTQRTTQPFVGFQDFALPQYSRGQIPDEQQSTWLFESAPTAIAFSGFYDFNQPQFARLNIELHQNHTIFDIVGDVSPRGGGTSLKLIDNEGNRLDRRKKRKTGFEPVIKYPVKPVDEPAKKVWTPPPGLVRQTPPKPPAAAPAFIDPQVVPSNLLDTMAQMRAAEEASRHIQDEQDAADIADILKFLD